MTDELKGRVLPDETRVFTQEEVNTILSRAVESQHPGAGGLTYAELVDTARQAGIDPAAIDAAVQDLPGLRATAVEDSQVEFEIARRRWRSWRAFALHFTVFAMFSVLIAFINIHEGGELFFPIPILAWGIGIAAHFTAVFFPTVFPNPDRAEAIRRELRKREEKSRRRAKNDKGDRSEKKERRSVASGELEASAKELGVAVQRGMATLLSDVAKTIHEEVDRASNRDKRDVPEGRDPARGSLGVRVETKARVGEVVERDLDDDDEGAEKRATKRR
jgi:2TM domain